MCNPCRVVVAVTHEEMHPEAPGHARGYGPAIEQGNQKAAALAELRPRWVCAGWSDRDALGLRPRPFDGGAANNTYSEWTKFPRLNWTTQMMATRYIVS